MPTVNEPPAAPAPAGAAPPDQPRPIMEMAFGYMQAQVAYVAARLGLADLLADGPLTTAELARRAGAHPASLRRLLRALAVLGLVAQVGPDRFELTAAGEPLRDGVPGSVRGLLVMICGPENWRSWGDLEATARSGETAWDRIYGMTQFEYYERHPEEAAIFNAAMAEHSRAVAPGVVAAGAFSRFGTVMDLGGGDGTLLGEVLRANPHLRGVLFDLPAGLRDAPATLAAAGVADRCQLLTGDFFASVPSGADACLMKLILHDWDDERAVALLRNCHRALAPEGRLLIVDHVLPELAAPGDPSPFLVDLTMLVSTGGKERTEREFRDLLAAAGFALAAVSDPLPLGYRLLEAVPA